MQRTRANDLAFEERERAQARQNRLEQLLAGGAGEQELLRGGFITESTNLAESRAKAAKAAAEQQAKELEAAGKRINLIGQVLGASRDQSTWDQGRAFLQQQGIDVAAFPAQFDAQGVRYATEQAVDAAKRIDQALAERTERRNAANENIVIGPDGRPSINPLAVSARSQIAAAGAAQAPIPVTYVQGVGPDGRPQFFGMPTSARPGQPAPMPTATGITPAAPATAKAGQPNEGQSNAALYASRMLEADQILNSTESDPVAVAGLQAMQSVPIIGSLTGGIANAASRPETQMVDQAQRNFINATLRRESGAAISPTEFDNARKQYFPQPGDSAEVIAQKARNRRTAIEGINNAAGPAKVEIPGAPGASVSRVANDAEYNALPSGAQFIGPDGQLRRKP
jgi:hypothetical protein